MPREYMTQYRRRHKISVEGMAAKCKVSTALIRLLEEEDDSVTHPNIARRVGKEYELSERRTLGLMPKHYRPSKHYDPDKYKITESPEDIFGIFRVDRRSKGGPAI